MPAPEPQVYLVGGAVRDRLLGRPVGERDWVVVGARPEQMRELGYRQVGRDFPVFLHPDSGEEYALARTERKSGHGYTGFEVNANPGVTLEEDLLRRDLTVNAIAEDGQGKLIDPFGGLGDLQARVLRHVSPAFVEDPLRVLRVARFAARYAKLGFTIAPETLELMRQIAASGELQHLPCERVWQELQRALGEDRPEIFFSTLQGCGAAQALFPDWQIQPASLHRLQRAAAITDNTVQRFAALCADLPGTLVETLCARLRAPNQYRELALLVCRHGGEARAREPAAILALLDQTDAWRRPQRFDEFLRTCTVAHDLADEQADHLRQALARCQHIDTAQWRGAGLKGRELGEKIRNERLRLLENLNAGSD